MNCLLDKVCMILLFASLAVFSACERNMDASTVPEDQLLAEVFNKKLFLSELEGIMQPGMNKADSVQLVNTYVEKWVRDNLLLHEAEKNIPLDLNIDELVRNYRASLVRHNFEKLLVELQLDSVITQEELAGYYEKNKEQYKLENSVVRCYFIKVPLTAPDIIDLDRYWNSNNEESYMKMLDYANAYANLYMLEDSSWYEIDNLLKQLPEKALKNYEIKAGKMYRNNDDRFRYYLRVFERISSGSIAPLDFVKGQITQLLLHKRKIKLLEDKKEALYEKEINTQNIRVYTN